jgi:hypothetical protein
MSWSSPDVAQCSIASAFDAIKKSNLPRIFIQTRLRRYMQVSAVDIMALNNGWNSQTYNELLIKVVDHSVEYSLCIYDITHMHEGSAVALHRYIVYVFRRLFEKKNIVCGTNFSVHSHIKLNQISHELKERKIKEKTSYWLFDPALGKTFCIMEERLSNLGE